ICITDCALMEQFFGTEDAAALPATFVFDQDGRLRRLFRGAVTEAELDGLLASFRDEAVSEDTLRLLAETYRSAGDFTQAAVFYGRLANLQPTRLDQIGQAWQRQRARDWIAKARAHRELGEIETARESYAEALRLDPGNRAAERERDALPRSR
ncbi:MAG: tetratricopeptide repeat protein, partial [Acidobacteria bacterium]|nr:tetratricopeptide repeat protein [Acidobacteriota bacterium]